jgi:hypothetical protein
MERGCKPFVNMPMVPEYLKMVAGEEAKSAATSSDSKILIDKVIRYHQGRIAPLLSEPQGYIRDIQNEIDSFKDIDRRIVTEIDSCSKYVTEYLLKHGLDKFEERIFRKPSDQKFYSSPIPRVAVSVNVLREDHCGIIADLDKRIKESALEQLDKNVLLPVVEYYGNQIACKCKQEDEYVKNIMAKADVLNSKFVPIYDNLQQMQSWIGQIKALDEIKV